MEFDPPDDAMVTIAALVSRVEALVVASMFEAAGVPVVVGGTAHSSVEVNSLALGGHRLWIPASHYLFASSILREVLGEVEWGFSRGLQRAVLRFCGAWAALWTVIAGGFWLGGAPFGYVLLAPLQALAIPVNPQGRGDYYLVSDPT